MLRVVQGAQLALLCHQPDWEMCGAEPTQWPRCEGGPLRALLHGCAGSARLCLQPPSVRVCAASSALRPPDTPQCRTPSLRTRERCQASGIFWGFFFCHGQLSAQGQCRAGPGRCHPHHRLPRAAPPQYCAGTGTERSCAILRLRGVCHDCHQGPQQPAGL